MKTIRNNTKGRIDIHLEAGATPLEIGGEGNPTEVEVSDEAFDKLAKLRSTSAIVSSYFEPGADGRPALEVVGSPGAAPTIAPDGKDDGKDDKAQSHATPAASTSNG